MYFIFCPHLNQSFLNISEEEPITSTSESPYPSVSTQIIKNDCKNLSQDKECGIAVSYLVDPVHLFLFLATKSPLQLSYQQWLHHPLHRKASLNLMQMKLLLLSTIKKTTSTTNSTKQRIEKLNSWLKDNKNVNNI